MGMNCEFHCDSCGYSLPDVSLGVGMMYPKVCADTLKRMKEGAYGPEFRADALNTPDAAVYIERVLFRCTTCNALKNDLALELCAPIGKPKPRDVPFSSACSGVDGDYVMDSDLGKRYRVIRGKLHVCGTCGRLMVPANPRQKIPCPKCGNDLKRIDTMCWD